MKMIDKFRKMASDTLDDLKAPFRTRMIDMEFDSLIQVDVERKRVEIEQQLIDARKQLSVAETRESARATIKRIADLKLQLEAEEKLAHIFASEKAFMFSPATADEGEKVKE